MTAATALRRMGCLLLAAVAVYSTLDHDPFGAGLALFAFFGLVAVGRLSTGPVAAPAPVPSTTDDPELRPIRRLYADEAWQEFYTSSPQ